mmetsp:Transcript_154989/g.496777  ORF Transcript_154989/g.496777 Transcript_154989/m.496777 type:complete len:334 (-) Transcript_154989:904-1905(-)
MLQSPRDLLRLQRRRRMWRQHASVLGRTRWRSASSASPRFFCHTLHALGEAAASSRHCRSLPYCTTIFWQTSIQASTSTALGHSTTPRCRLGRSASSSRFGGSGSLQAGGWIKDKRVSARRRCLMRSSARIWAALDPMSFSSWHSASSAASGPTLHDPTRIGNSSLVGRPLLSFRWCHRWGSCTQMSGYTCTARTTCLSSKRSLARQLSVTIASGAWTSGSTTFSAARHFAPSIQTRRITSSFRRMLVVTRSRASTSSTSWTRSTRPSCSTCRTLGAVAVRTIFFPSTTSTSSHLGGSTFRTAFSSPPRPRWALSAPSMSSLRTSPDFRHSIP